MPSLVTVIVPTFNRLALLRETVSSVLHQSYSDWELLIVDDNSTDLTRDWVKSLTTDDSRIQLLERIAHMPGSRGTQVCRNLGFEMARGDAIIFLDSDDILSPNCLERRLRVLSSDEAYDAVVGQALCFSCTVGDLGTDKIWAPWSDSNDDLDCFLANDIPWQTSGPLWRREALARVGDWNEQLFRGAQDYEFHVRALARGVRFYKLLGIDYYWRTPRIDSYSSLEGFKKRHCDGGMIAAYRMIMDEVICCNVDTPLRRKIMANTVIHFSVLCRNFGGKASVAERGILDAHRHGLIGAVSTILFRLLLRVWWHFLGRVPAMSLMTRLSPFIQSQTSLLS